MTINGPRLETLSGGKPRQVVVILHGYGADGNDLIEIGRVLQPAFPDALFAAPNAPEACEGVGFGYQWFPITVDALQAGRFEGAKRAAPAVREYLGALWSETGLGAGETVLSGFSQGAMMALHVGLGLAKPLAGIVAVSGALIAPEPIASKPPVQLVHGELDGVVYPRYSREAFARLKEEGVDVALHLSPGIGHSISPDGLAAAAAFLGRVLPPKGA
jgi:phospholipase/carboxylesterase